MSYVGENLYKEFHLKQSFDNPRVIIKISYSILLKLGMDVISQLEILHKLGVVHNDLKFQNICYNKHKNCYSMIDFALVTRIFTKEGIHKKQLKLKYFFGNSMFASEAQVELKSTSRRCDLESFLSIISFLYNGTLPIIDIVHDQQNAKDKKEILDHMETYRRTHKESLRDSIKESLPKNLRNAHTYIHTLDFKSKPDYGLLKLFFATDRG